MEQTVGRWRRDIQNEALELTDRRGEWRNSTATGNFHPNMLWRLQSRSGNQFSPWILHRCLGWKSPRRRWNSIPPPGFTRTAKLGERGIVPRTREERPRSRGAGRSEISRIRRGPPPPPWSSPLSRLPLPLDRPLVPPPAQGFPSQAIQGGGPLSLLGLHAAHTLLNA